MTKQCKVLWNSCPHLFPTWGLKFKFHKLHKLYDGQHKRRKNDWRYEKYDIRREWVLRRGRVRITGLTLRSLTQIDRSIGNKKCTREFSEKTIHDAFFRSWSYAVQGAEWTCSQVCSCSLLNLQNAKMHELRACKNMGGKIRINGKNVFQLVLVDPTPWWTP